MSDENNKNQGDEETRRTSGTENKEDSNVKAPPLEPKHKGIGGLHWVFATTGLVLGAVIMFFISASTGLEASGVSEKEAVAEAHALYEDNLISPSTAEWAPLEDTETEYLGDDRYYTKSYVDAQNENAVQARQEFEVWYEYDEDEEEWFMEDWIVTN